MLRFIMIAAATVVITTPALAQTAPPSQTTGYSKSRDPNRIVCQYEEQLGTRLGGRKICMTAAQWDQLRRDSRDVVDNFQHHATSPGSPNGG